MKIALRLINIDASQTRDTILQHPTAVALHERQRRSHLKLRKELRPFLNPVVVDQADVSRMKLLYGVAHGLVVHAFIRVVSKQLGSENKQCSA